MESVGKTARTVFAALKDHKSAARSPTAVHFVDHTRPALTDIEASLSRTARHQFLPHVDLIREVLHGFRVEDMVGDSDFDEFKRMRNRHVDLGMLNTAPEHYRLS